MFDSFYANTMRAMMTFAGRAIRRRERLKKMGITGAFDTEAREAIIVQQAQIESLQRGMSVIHDWLASGAFNGSKSAFALNEALALQAPTFGDEPEDENDEAGHEAIEKFCVEAHDEETKALRDELSARGMIAVNREALNKLLRDMAGEGYDLAAAQDILKQNTL